MVMMVVLVVDDHQAGPGQCGVEGAAQVHRPLQEPQGAGPALLHRQVQRKAGLYGRPDTTHHPSGGGGTSSVHWRQAVGRQAGNRQACGGLAGWLTC